MRDHKFSKFFLGENIYIKKGRENEKVNKLNGTVCLFVFVFYQTNLCQILLDGIWFLC